MSTATYRKCAGLSVFLTAAAIAGIAMFAKRAKAAPPPGGFAVDYVAVVNESYVYRFRDGPRVCYVMNRKGPYAGAIGLSCVVSP